MFSFFSKKIKTYQQNNTVIYVVGDSIIIHYKNYYTLILTLDSIKITYNNETFFTFATIAELRRHLTFILNNRKNLNIQEYTYILQYFDRWNLLKYDVTFLKKVVAYVDDIEEQNESEDDFYEDESYPLYMTEPNGLFKNVLADYHQIHLRDYLNCQFYVFRNKIYSSIHVDYKLGHILQILERFLRVYSYTSINDELFYYIRGYEGSLLIYYDSDISSYKILKNNDGFSNPSKTFFKETFIQKEDIHSEVLSFCAYEINHNDDMKDFINHTLTIANFSCFADEHEITGDDLTVLDMIQY